MFRHPYADLVEAARAYAIAVTVMELSLQSRRDEKSTSVQQVAAGLWATPKRRAAAQQVASSVIQAAIKVRAGFPNGPMGARSPREFLARAEDALCTALLNHPPTAMERIGVKVSALTRAMSSTPQEDPGSAMAWSELQTNDKPRTRELLDESMSLLVTADMTRSAVHAETDSGLNL